MRISRKTMVAEKIVTCVAVASLVCALVVPQTINCINKEKTIGSKRHVVSSYINTSDGRTFEIEENSTLYYGDDGKLYQLRENRTWYNPIVTYEAVDSEITGTLVTEIERR